MFSRCCLQTLLSAAGPAWGLEKQGRTLPSCYLLASPLSPALLSCWEPGGVGASCGGSPCGGLSLLGRQKQTTTSSVGASPSPLPKAFLLSPLQQCYCNMGQGLEVESKGETQQPPARRRTRSRAGSWISAFFKKKKNNAQQTCGVFRPRCQAILSRSARLGPPATLQRVLLRFLIKGQKLEAAGNRLFAPMPNSLYRKGQTSHGKGSPGDAEIGTPNWASEGEKLLKLCFRTGKVCPCKASLLDLFMGVYLGARREGRAGWVVNGMDPMLPILADVAGVKSFPQAPLKALLSLRHRSHHMKATSGYCFENNDQKMTILISAVLTDSAC